jgi:hypothetical protein
MLQTAPQFTPFQLLDAGRRAEADGQFDTAFQYYRQTVDQYAYSPEAAHASEALARLNAARQPRIWQANGVAGVGETGGRWPGAGRKGRRPKLPAPRPDYRIGSWLAKALGVMSWATVVLGLVVLAAVPVQAVLARPELPLGSLGLAGAALAIALIGCLGVALGQALRALFDQANATKELVAIERAKAGYASGLD